MGWFPYYNDLRHERLKTLQNIYDAIFRKNSSWPKAADYFRKKFHNRKSTGF